MFEKNDSILIINEFISLIFKTYLNIDKLNIRTYSQIKYINFKLVHSNILIIVPQHFF